MSIVVPVLDPVTVIAASSPGGFETRHKITGREGVEAPSLGVVDAWRVESVLSGARVTSWITDGGELIKQSIPPGMTALRDEGGRVSEDGLSALDIEGATSIPSNVAIKDPRGLMYMKAEIEGISPEDGFDLSDAYRQSFDGKYVSIRAGDTSSVKTYMLPNKEPEFAPYLAPETLIQSGDPEIISKSREILGGEEDSLEGGEKAERLGFQLSQKDGHGRHSQRQGRAEDGLGGLQRALGPLRGAGQGRGNPDKNGVRYNISRRKILLSRVERGIRR